MLNFECFKYMNLNNIHMMKTEQQQHFIYVRLPEYLRQFLRVKYGGEPILLPATHPCMGLMDKWMIRTPNMKPVHSGTLCEALLDENMRKMVDESVQWFVPSEDERKEYLRIVIPANVRKYTSCIATDGFWQLMREGYSQFKQVVKEEFWNDCFAFLNDCNSRAHARGETVTREDAMSDFMTIYNIPMEQFETMLRYHTRERTRMRKEIEHRREMLQASSGNKMIYT